MADARRIDRHMGGERVARSGDAAMAALARRQHGVVSRPQLHALGMGDDAIDLRLAAARLHLLHRGVYAVGHPLLTPHGRWMAAVLACGRDARLSDGAAAALWSLRTSARTKIAVTVPAAGGRRSRPGLRVHRRPTLRPGDTTVHEGIPVTTPARTVMDLAPALTTRRLERLLDRMEELQLFDLAAFTALLRAHHGERGTAALRAVLATHTAGTTLTRSELEERFLALCDRSGVARPRVNAHVAGLEVDFLFPRERLVAETDGWRYHRGRLAFERDRRRDATLLRSGYRTLRLTHAQVVEDAPTVVQTLRAALRSAA
jgi:very-short-patch-repair endonuclease